MRIQISPLAGAGRSGHPIIDSVPPNTLLGSYKNIIIKKVLTSRHVSVVSFSYDPYVN